MRKKKRNALKDVETLQRQGRERVLIGFCAPVERKAVRHTVLVEQGEAVRGKQHNKGGSQIPRGWYSRNSQFN